MATPLSGVKIVEMTSLGASPGVAIAAGFCAKLAASLGASVMITPQLAERAGLPPALRTFLDENKLVRDMDDDWKSADAVIADFSSVETFESLPDACPAIRVAMAAGNASAGFALETEYTLAARTGLLDMIGDPDRAPLPLPGHQPSFAAGLAAYTGLAGALLRRRSEPGYSERVDANIEDALLWLNWKSVLSESWGVETPTRRGRLTEWPILRCADGWVALVYRDVDWPALKHLLDDPRLDDQRFASRQGRNENRSELFGIIETAFAQMNRAEITRQSLALRLPIGPVIEPQELLSDPQYAARCAFIHSQDAHGDTRPHQKMPVNWLAPNIVAPVAASVHEASLSNG